MKTTTFTLLNKKQKIWQDWKISVISEIVLFSNSESVKALVLALVLVCMHIHTYIHMYKSINAFVCKFYLNNFKWK